LLTTANALPCADEQAYTPMTRRRRPPEPKTGTSTAPRGPDESRPAREGPLDTTPATNFPVVGVGASAGGLEAFTELLRHLPPDLGMGFVLVQHLDPAHESALTHLLTRATTMPVHEVTNHLRVEPDHVYVIPPNTQMAIVGGVLKLTPRSYVRGATRSIDFFFEALAQDQRERAIGVVLSGTATDGTLGLETIKAEGGLTFAQDDTAKYDSMPRSAVAAGVVDFVLSPVAIAAELTRIARHPFVRAEPGTEAVAMPSEAEREADQREPKEAPLASGGHGTPRTGSRQAKAEAQQGADGSADGFKAILLLLRTHCGVDFSLYKSSTIQRRVMRRMVLNRHETLAAYAAYLKGNAKELDALYSDVLISVTSFFRNPEAFDTLKDKVFPTLLAQRRRDQPVRVWVLGCSTGQEAYSLAMTFAEAAGATSPAPTLQIFATDLNEALLDKARNGLYAKSLAQDVSSERLQRFFVEEEGGYRVTKLLREQVVFARQNVMSDPPFSRIDLITCRNLLIYLEPELQKKIFPSFHYALKPGGFLFLGASESIGTFTNLFEPADKRHKIFARKAVTTPVFRLPLPPTARGRLASVGGQVPPPPSREPALPDDPRGGFSAQREADRISVSQFAPPGVLVDAAGQVLQFRGATGAFLAPPQGKASFDVLKMAREGLMVPLRTALRKAKRDNTPVRRDGLRVRDSGGTRALALQVIPLRNLKEPCFLVLFEDAPAAPGGHAPSAPPVGARKAASRVAELERELTETREYLQSVQELNEAATEELQASGEEVQSANEELQSINEELETSKEELESTNEELTTINDEMISRNSELHRVNADLNNVQLSIQTAILLLARDFTIRRFTPLAGKIFNLLPTDVGRAIGGVRHNLDAPDLEGLLAEVIDTMSLREREVRDKDGRWYELRARPYLTFDNKIDGVVLVLSDIDALKRSQRSVEAERDYAEAILRATPVPFVVLRSDLRVNSASEAFYRSFGVTPAETEGRLVYELGNGQWNIPVLRGLLEEIVPLNTVFNGFEVTHESVTIGTRTMLLAARRMESVDGVPERILLAIDDISELKRAETVLRQNAGLFSSIVDQSPTGTYVVNAEFRMQQINALAAPVFGMVHPLIGRDFAEILTVLWGAELGEQIAGIFRHTLETGERYVSTAFAERRLDLGEEQSFEWEIQRVLLAEGQYGVVCYFVDTTARSRANNVLRESEERIRLATEATAVGIWEWHLATDRARWDARMFAIYGIPPTPDGSVAYADWSAAVLPEDLAGQQRALADALRRGGHSRQIFRIVRRDNGECRHIEAVETVRANAQGQVDTVVGTNLDVTARVHMEEALQQADRRKDEFLATLAHELRNPLAPIRNGLQLLRLADKDSPTAALAQAMMERQLKHMVGLVDDLMDVSRIASGKIELRKTRVSLSAAVTSGVETSRPLIEEMGHDLSVTLPRHPVTVDGDANRLAQVFTNLLNNAAKYSDRGGRIGLTVERAGSDVLVSVRDNGIGIAPEQLQRIFAMFAQVERSVEKSRGGLGIGLSLARQLVELHGGRLVARSDGLGTGAEFVVRLPIMMETEEPRAAAREDGSGAAVTPLRILIVDDNRDGADSLTMLLAGMGHTARSAYDGQQGLDVADEFHPEVVLCDIGLPVLDGYEVCRRIRVEAWGKDAILIAVTGRGQDEDRRRSQTAGFDWHIVKPMDPQVLFKILAGPLARDGTGSA